MALTKRLIGVIIGPKTMGTIKKNVVKNVTKLAFIKNMCNFSLRLLFSDSTTEKYSFADAISLPFLSSIFTVIE